MCNICARAYQYQSSKPRLTLEAIPEGGTEETGDGDDAVEEDEEQEEIREEEQGEEEEQEEKEAEEMGTGDAVVISMYNIYNNVTSQLASLALLFPDQRGLPCIISVAISVIRVAIRVAISVIRVAITVISVY